MTFGRGRRAWLVVASALVPGLLVVAACSPNPTSAASPDDTSVTTAAPSEGLATPTEPADTTLPPIVDTAAVEKVPLERTLNMGDKGDDVLRLQQRLKDLAFDPGKIDGIYGDHTAESVWAYKALIFGERWDKDMSSKVTAAMWDRMQEPLGLSPRKDGDTPRHFEVYLPEQVGVLVSDGQIRLITHVSTGSGKHWCNPRRALPDANGETPTSTAASNPVLYCNDSITPGGSYRFTFKRTGTFQGFYGDLWNPTFFNGGIAVHGFDSVPYYPASHGCVRIPNHIADYFQSLVRIRDQVFVFDGKTDPDVLGPVAAPIDTVDPNSTSTSSSTSTTVKPTTTTAKPTTTTAKATTVAPTAATTVAPTTTKPTAAPTTPATPPTTAPPGTTTTTVKP